ncbi:MAG: nickel-responsive transcriptional regulator NikR [Candidatus Aminicenantia bacterium]
MKKKVVRFGVSMDEELIKKFDNLISIKGYSNRSEAIRDLIRNNLVEEEWEKGKEIAGAIVFVYNHHKRELADKILDLQHDYNEIIKSTLHIHLDHYNCLEVVVVKGEAGTIRELYNKLYAMKGVKHCSLARTSTGKELV